MKFLYIFSLIVLFSCKNERQNISDCSEITRPFKTYTEATSTIKSVDFKLTDDVDTSKSSWIRSAEYYSCDKLVGYLIFTTVRNEYIHQDVPIEVWKEFKNADSFGKYYNKNIKKRYRLVPQNEK